MNVKASNIEIRNATLKYQGVLIFDHLNLIIPAGKITCLLGPSGVGKTSLLEMIAGLIITKTNAEEFIQGDITDDQGRTLPSHIAYLAQNDSLLPWLNALDNALLGYHLRGNLNPTIIERAQSLFKKLGLAQAQKKYPRHLSGGMRQRVALIRTFLEDTPIILLDEPFSALDAITRFQLQTLTCELLKNKTVFLVTHDPTEALRLADKIEILAGRPARLQNSIELTTSAPRDLDNPEVLAKQAALFRALTAANEMPS